MINHYSNDPHWTKARYYGKCKQCGKSIRKGDTIYYYPLTKTVLCNAESCGKQAHRDFKSYQAAEDFMYR